MDRILVASSNDKATAMLVSLLKETFPPCKTSIAATGLETRRAVGSQSRKMRIFLLINWKISA